MRDQVILVTGGTGTFGQAFTRHALERGARQVRVFSRDELKQSEMACAINDARVEYLCGDVRDYDRLLTALDGVDVCIHAAAMKRIEKCERDPQEAVKTNVLGSMNVANACLKAGVKHAVALSSDKAVYPVNTYGKTKALMENLWIQSNVYRGARHPTRFSVVRYGNVIGSRGSVVRLFKDQAKGGVLRVTHSRMTRFFLRIEEAVALVSYALQMHQGGEIFLPRIKAYSIMALAKVIAPEARIVITAAAPGEKVHESLFTAEENKRSTFKGRSQVIHPMAPTWSYKMPDMDFAPEFEPKEETSENAKHYTNEEIGRLLSSCA